MDQNGEYPESDRDREYQRVKSVYKDQQRTMLLAKKFLEAEARTLGPGNGWLADPIKKTRERLLNSMRAQLTSLEQAIEILPVVPSII